jgi:hypothetical protein
MITADSLLRYHLNQLVKPKWSVFLVAFGLAASSLDKDATSEACSGMATEGEQKGTQPKHRGIPKD